MLEEKMIERQQTQLKFHRVLYGILIAFICVVYCMDAQNATLNYLWLLIGTVAILALESVCSRFLFWNRFVVLHIFTYIQYIFYLVIISLIHSQNLYLAIASSVLMFTFMFEFSYMQESTTDYISIRNLLFLVLPTMLCIFVYFSAKGINYDAFFLLFIYAMMIVFNIMAVHLFYRNEHKLMIQNQQLMTEIENMENNNDKLVKFKDRIQKVNDELNMQRVQLGQMNKEIQQSNLELAAQAEILKFISNSISLDIPTVMNYILDVILRVRKVEFCAIYIAENVSFNKKSMFESRCTSLPDLKDFPEMEDLFRLAGDKEGDQKVIHQFPEQNYPGISKTKTRALLVLPLFLEGEKYGVLVSGSRHSGSFENYLAFYDSIVPQLNLAIHNIKMYAQMRHTAQTDGLTGINNRTYFNKLFAEQMEWTITLKEPLTVALFDIDKFKRINDTYGHLVGDEVIKRIAQIAAEHIEEPELGFICRYGGEEFVIALPNMGVEEALPIIEKLHKSIAETRVEAYGQVVTMNVSIGVSSYPALCEDVNQLIKRADWSMYYAKEHGRGQIKVDGPDVAG